jgi:hypothetical protein
MKSTTFNSPEIKTISESVPDSHVPQVAAPQTVCLKVRSRGGRHHLQCRAGFGNAQTGTSPSLNGEAAEAVSPWLASQRAVPLEPSTEARTLAHSVGQTAHAMWGESGVRRGLASGVAGLLMGAAISLSAAPPSQKHWREYH